MSVKINIPGYLQPFTNNNEEVEVNGNSVGGCLGHLIKQFPGIEEMLFAKHGQLFDYVNVFINGEDAYPNELDKPIKDGDELHVIYIIGGG